jgi:hypothetical protein
MAVRSANDDQRRSPRLASHAGGRWFDPSCAHRQLMVENGNSDEPDRGGELYVEPVEVKTSPN